MKRILAVSLLALFVCATASAQQVYPSRIGNLCASDLAVATASSTYNSGYAASGAIDGDRIGQNCSFTGGTSCWGNGGGWADSTRDVWNDWLRVDFGRAHSIGRVVVVTFQDNYSTPRIEPYLGLKVGGNYTIEDYTIEVLNTSGVWVEVAEQEENEDIIREHVFSPVVGTAVRITVTDGYASFSRVIEFEAYSK